MHYQYLEHILKEKNWCYLRTLKPLILSSQFYEIPKALWPLTSPQSSDKGFATPSSELRFNKCPQGKRSCSVSGSSLLFSSCYDLAPVLSSCFSKCLMTLNRYFIFPLAFCSREICSGSITSYCILTRRKNPMSADNFEGMLDST